MDPTAFCPKPRSDLTAQQLSTQVDAAATALASLRHQLADSLQDEESLVSLARCREALDQLEDLLTSCTPAPTDMGQANANVMNVVKRALGSDTEGLAQFKQFAKGLAKGGVSPQKFIRKAKSVLGESTAHELMPAMVSLLAMTKPAQSQALLAAMAEEGEQHACRRFPRKAVDLQAEPVLKGCFVAQQDGPTEVLTMAEPVLHLVLCVHGIGMHMDFIEGQHEQAGGGALTSLRASFKAACARFGLEFQVELLPVEWHRNLHQGYHLDKVFEAIMPQGNSGLRDFSKSTAMDVLYYSSTKFGPIIRRDVTQQLNTQYRDFMTRHPGYRGSVSVFAHSLGSAIVYDILAREHGSAQLDFQVQNFFAAGSPAPVFVVSAGHAQLREGSSTVQPGDFYPRAEHYYNLIHPSDPVAYRAEPLLLGRDATGELPCLPHHSASTEARYGQMGAAELCAVYEELMVAGEEERVDYGLVPRRRETLAEVLYAAECHSMYWSSPDVAMFMAAALLRPTMRAVLQRCPQALPTIKSSLGLMQQHSTLQLHGAVQRFDVGTNEWCSGWAAVQDQHLFVLPDKPGLAPKGTVVMVGATATMHSSTQVTVHAPLQFDPTGKLYNSERVLVLEAKEGQDAHELLEQLRAAVLPMPEGQEDAAAVLCGAQGQDASLRYFGGCWSALVRKEGRRGVCCVLCAVCCVLCAVCCVPCCAGFFAMLFACCTVCRVLCVQPCVLGSCVPCAVCCVCSRACWALVCVCRELAGIKGMSWQDRWLVTRPGSLDYYEHPPVLSALRSIPLPQCTLKGDACRLLLVLLKASGVCLEFRLTTEEDFDVWRTRLGALVAAVSIESTRERRASSVAAPAEHSTPDSVVEATIDSFEVVEHPDGKPSHAVYVLYTQGLHTASVVTKRFSEFVALHNALQKELSGRVSLPERPAKEIKLFEATKFDPKYLKTRQGELQRYIRKLVLLKEVVLSRVFLDFIQATPKTPKHNND